MTNPPNPEAVEAVARCLKEHFAAVQSLIATMSDEEILRYESQINRVSETVEALSDDKLTVALAAMPGEPVAWRVKYRAGGWSLTDDKESMYLLSQHGEDVQPLYTHPATSREGK